MPGFTRVDFPLFRKITTPVQSAAAVSVSVRASTVVARWRCAARAHFLGGGGGGVFGVGGFERAQSFLRRGAE